MAPVTDIPLWDGPPPGTEDWTHEQIGPVPFAPGVEIVRNVTVPTLTPHLPDGEARAAVIVAPGGAYRFVAIEHEGHALARWLCDRGFAAYVLTYRVVPTPPDEAGLRDHLGAMFTQPGGWEAAVPDALLADGPQAVRRARERHERVLMIGISAGAKLTVETLRAGATLDAVALLYPPHVDDMDAAPGGAPPLFTVMAADDPLGTRGALRLHELWREAGQHSELHLFDRGGHGFGMNPTGLPVDRWTELLGAWLDLVTGT